MIRSTDPILGPSRGTPNAFLAVFVLPDQKDRDYVAAVARWAAIAGVDAAIVYDQFAQECTDPGANSPGTSFRWNNDLNPAGIGIPHDSTNQPVRIANGDEAARIHIQCLYALVKRKLHPGVPVPPAWNPWFSTVWLPKVTDPPAPRVRTLADLNLRYIASDGDGRATWAWDEDYLAGLLGYAARWLPGVPEFSVSSPGRQPEGGTIAVPRPRILLTEGHRNTTGGNPEEASLTPFITNDDARALRDAGYTVDIFQDIDGNAITNFTEGDLDAVGQGVLNWARSHLGEALVFLDLHYEGEDEGIRGCFAIIPDETGLTGNAPNSTPGDDIWANNPLDVKLGRAIAQHIAAATGLQLRTSDVTEPGLMSETQTGVGGDGFRLAMFGWTAPVRDRMVRLVIEHGNHQDSHDHAIIFQENFTNKCAAALVAAMNEVYGPAPAAVQGHPTGSTSSGEFAKPAALPPVSTHVVPYARTLTVIKEYTPRAVASEHGAVTGPRVPVINPKSGQPNVVQPKLLIVAEDGSVWFVTAGGSRHPAWAFFPAGDGT